MNSTNCKQTHKDDIVNNALWGSTRGGQSDFKEVARFPFEERIEDGYSSCIYDAAAISTRDLTTWPPCALLPSSLHSSSLGRVRGWAQHTLPLYVVYMLCTSSLFALYIPYLYSFVYLRPALYANVGGFQVQLRIIPDGKRDER